MPIPVSLAVSHLTVIISQTPTPNPFNLTDSTHALGAKLLKKPSQELSIRPISPPSLSLDRTPKSSRTWTGRWTGACRAPGAA